MLLKFTTTDMFNSCLVNVATGDSTYQITTVLVPESKLHKPVTPSPSSSKTTTTSEEFSPVKEYTDRRERQKQVTCRHTRITNSSGDVLADVFWHGRHPKIIIEGEMIGGLNDLFGSSSTRFMPKVLAVPTKFDADYIWTATSESLTLIDYSTEQVRGTFHQNVLRFPSPLKGSKSKPIISIQTQTPSMPPLSLSPSPGSPISTKSLFKTPSRIFSSSKFSLPSTTEETTYKDCPVKSTFVPTHVPGFGSNYLEFTPHPLSKDVEIILSFLIMEILRRGRFSLTPYTFENPTIWQLKEARDIVLRRIRRNTV